MSIEAVVVDIDGTLVDSNYLHVVAWARSFAQKGLMVPSSRLHAFMGMGGDQLVGAVAGDDVEEQHGDELREAWSKQYDALLDDLRPLGRAAEMLAEIHSRGVKVILASSGKLDHTRCSLGLLGLTEESYPMITAEDVEQTKPDGELVQVALEKVGVSSGLMLGDTVWDVKAAARVGVPAICVLTGGIDRAVLQAAGARAVFDDPADVLDHLDEILG